MSRAYFQALKRSFRRNICQKLELSRDGGLAWEVLLQGLDMTSGEPD